MAGDKRHARLRFRSWHRGTREMDLLLGSFADTHLHAFTPEQLDCYEALLQESDPDLYDWITGVQPVPAPHTSPVMEMLSRHRFGNFSSAKNL